MIDKTQMEKQAIKAARHPVWEALTELGLAPEIEKLSDPAAALDQIIEASWDGCRGSMRDQVAQGEVPF